MEGDAVEREDLNQRADNVRNYEEAILVVKEYEIIIGSSMWNLQYGLQTRTSIKKIQGVE